MVTREAMARAIKAVIEPEFSYDIYLPDDLIEAAADAALALVRGEHQHLHDMIAEESEARGRAQQRAEAAEHVLPHVREEAWTKAKAAEYWQDEYDKLQAQLQAAERERDQYRNGCNEWNEKFEAYRAELQRKWEDQVITAQMALDAHDEWKRRAEDAQAQLQALYLALRIASRIIGDAYPMPTRWHEDFSDLLDRARATLASPPTGEPTAAQAMAAVEKYRGAWKDVPLLPDEASPPGPTGVIPATPGVPSSDVGADGSFPFYTCCGYNEGMRGRYFRGCSLPVGHEGEHKVRSYKVETPPWPASPPAPEGERP